MADNLPALVQVLPAELYNEVLKLTFTAPNELRKIEANYHPPKLLQVSRATRQLFAQSYYGQASPFFISKMLVTKWARSLPKRHLDLIGDIKLPDAKAWSSYAIGRAIYSVPIEDIHSEPTKKLLEELKDLSDDTNDGVLKVRRVVRDRGEEGLWVSLDEVFLPL